MAAPIRHIGDTRLLDALDALVTAANPLPVSGAITTTPVAITSTGAVATVVNNAVGTLVAANASRKRLTIYYPPDVPNVNKRVFINVTANATAALFEVALDPGGFYEVVSSTSAYTALANGGGPRTVMVTEYV
jgi:hypothetical protein